MKDLIKNRLNEEFGKQDVTKEISAFIDGQTFKNKIEKIIKDKLKDNKEYTKPSVSRRRKKQKAVYIQKLKTLDDKVERGDVRLTPTKPKKKR